MNKLEQAARQALEALETLDCGNSYKTHNAATALRKALASRCQTTTTEQAEQEPVAEVVLRNQTVGFGRTEERKDIQFLAEVGVGTKLYAAPVRTKDLTEEELRQVLDKHCGDGLMAIAYAVIAADREKNRG